MPFGASIVGPASRCSDRAPVVDGALARVADGFKTLTGRSFARTLSRMLMILLYPTSKSFSPTIGGLPSTTAPAIILPAGFNQIHWNRLSTQHQRNCVSLVGHRLHRARAIRSDIHPLLATVFEGVGERRFAGADQKLFGSTRLHFH